MPRKIILVKKWGMYPEGHVFEDPSDATVRELCHDKDFGRLVGDDHFLRQLKSEKKATAELLAEAEQQKQTGVIEYVVPKEEDDVWKDQLEKEKETITLDGVEKDLSDIVETLPIAAHKVTEKKAAIKSKKKRAAPKRRKKAQRKKS